MSWWSARRSNGFCWSYTGIIANQEIWKVGLSETHSLGKPRSLRSQWLIKSHLMEQVAAKKDEDGQRMMKSEYFLKRSEPRRGIEYFLVKMVMEWWKLIFPTDFLRFRSHVVANTLCTTGEVHTLICHTHIFLHIVRAQSHSHIFSRVHIHAWLKGAKKVLCTWCHISPSRLLLSHVPPISAVLARSLRDHSRLRFSPTIPSTHSCLTFLSSNRRTRATPHMHREVWLTGQVRCKHRDGKQQVPRKVAVMQQGRVFENKVRSLKSFERTVRQRTWQWWTEGKTFLPYRTMSARKPTQRVKELASLPRTTLGQHARKIEERILKKRASLNHMRAIDRQKKRRRNIHKRASRRDVVIEHEASSLVRDVLIRHFLCSSSWEVLPNDCVFLASRAACARSQ